MSGDISFQVEHASGLIRVIGRGMWSPEQARWHFAQLDIAIHALRSQGRPVRTLVDLRQARVQTRETAEAMMHGTRRVHGPADRVAIVTPSALHGMQVKATAKVDQLALFQDMAKALSWLSAQPVEAL